MLKCLGYAKGKGPQINLNRKRKKKRNFTKERKFHNNDLTIGKFSYLRPNNPTMFMNGHLSLRSTNFEISCELEL